MRWIGDQETYEMLEHATSTTGPGFVLSEEGDEELSDDWWLEQENAKAGQPGFSPVRPDPSTKIGGAPATLREAVEVLRELLADHDAMVKAHNKGHGDAPCSSADAAREFMGRYVRDRVWSVRARPQMEPDA